MNSVDTKSTEHTIIFINKQGKGLRSCYNCLIGYFLVTVFSENISTNILFRLLENGTRNSWWMSQVNNIFIPKGQKSNEDSVFQNPQMWSGVWTPPSWSPTPSAQATTCSSPSPDALSPVSWGQSRCGIIITLEWSLSLSFCRKWARVRSAAGCAPGVR